MYSPPYLQKMYKNLCSQQMTACQNLPYIYFVTFKLNNTSFQRNDG